MPLRFNRRVELFPGARLNFSKSGVSLSLGGRGVHFTIGGKGTRETVGLPGTGLYWTEEQRWRDKRPPGQPSSLPRRRARMGTWRTQRASGPRPPLD